MNLTTNLAGQAVIGKFQDFCRIVDSEYSRAVSNDINVVGALRALKRAPPRPSDYSDAKAFGADWMVYNYLRKFPALPGSRQKDREAAALRSWEAAELKCRATNVRIDAFERGYGLPLAELLPSIGPNVSVASVISLAQQKIARVLGPYNEKHAFAECRWSGGATADHRRGTPFTVKMTSRISVTASALPLLRKVLRRDIHWSAAVVGCEPAGYCSLLDEAFTITDCNRHTTVPKTAYTERSIGIEPTGNAFLQQGIGRYIRRRLKGCGVDLDNQVPSQKKAAEAVFEGLSTLDLESASDTVSRKLIHLLLPRRWFIVLDRLRSPITRLKDGRLFLLEKFSSMGNAFTFELESLVFWALAASVTELTGSSAERVKHVTVYGDDIIVPRESSMALKVVLEICGFTMNEAKTFYCGPFYESCGKHYFLGEDVTPAIQDCEVRSLPEVIRYYNRVVRWQYRMSGELFSKSSSRLVSGVKYGPHIMPFCEEGDECFIVPVSEIGGIPHCPNHGYLLDAVMPITPLREMVRQDAALAYKLRKPAHLNEDPRGYSATAGRETYRRMKVRRSGDRFLPI